MVYLSPLAEQSCLTDVCARLPTGQSAQARLAEALAREVG